MIYDLTITANTKQDQDVELVLKSKIKRPPMYAVILLNDDFTPMDLVVEILQLYFAMNREKATEVMFNIHYQGQGLAGIYPKDIAETKAKQVIDHARTEGYPLMCIAEVHH